MSVENPRGYTEYRIRDRVRVQGDKRIGTIVEDIGGKIIVKYPEGDKVKTIPAYLDLVTEEPEKEAREGVTPEEYDEVVKDFLADIEMETEAENQKDKDHLLEFVKEICGQLKTRLFE